MPFFGIGFLILSRSLREAFYLGSFDVKTLPYITATVAVLALPVVGGFVRLLAIYRTKTVMRAVLVLISSGLGLMWPFLRDSKIAVVAFYLWTTLGTLLITSGFWVLTAEQFAVRGAKRLFGLISAGGTAGAMIVGTSLGWLTEALGLYSLVLVLIAMAILIILVQWALPNDVSSRSTPKKEESTSIKESLSLVWNTKHLRILGLIIMTATMASTLIDYQF